MRMAYVSLLAAIPRRFSPLLAMIVACNLAAAAEMQYPLAIAAGKEGTVYVADRNLPGIWKINAGEPTLFFEASKKLRSPLNAVRCLAIDPEGRLLAGDSATRQVYRFDESAAPVPVLKNATGIGIPMSIAVAQDGTLFIADLEVGRIWKVNPSEGQPNEFATVAAPRGLAFDPAGNLWVVSHGDNQLLRISPAGEVETVVPGRPFQFPHNVVVDQDGAAYISDGYARTIWKVDESRQPKSWVSGEPLINPVGLAWQGDQLLISDSRARAVFAAAPTGKLTSVVATTARED